MRMRKIVLYVGLLAIIVGGGPYFTGYLVETKFQDVVRVISDIDSINVAIVKYDRGWRKSFAQTRITFKGEYPHAAIDTLYFLTPEQKNQLKGEGLSILMDHDIRHGPFVQMKDGDWKDWRFALATFHSNTQLTAQTKEMLEKILGQSKLLDINGEISIEGAVQVNFQGVPLKYAEGNPESLAWNWKGMHGNWKLSRDMKQFQAELVFPGLTLQSAGKSVGFQDVIGRYDLHKTPEDLWLGKITGNVQSMVITDSQDSANNASFSALTMGSVSDSVTGLIDGSCSVTIEQIKVIDKIFGPFNLVVSIKNLDAIFWKALVELSKDAQNPTTQGQLVQNLMAKLPNLLRNRPVFSVDNVSLKTSDGDLKGFFNIAIGGADATDINNTGQIIKSIVAKASGVLPKPILVEILTQQYIQNAEAANAVARQANQPEQSLDVIKQNSAQKVQETLSGAINEGYLIEKDNYYSTEMEFIEGELKVNGKPMQVPTNPAALPGGTPPTSSPVPGTSSSVQ